MTKPKNRKPKEETENKQQISIRLPKQLIEKLEALATKEKRSLSGQIEYLIEKGLDV